MKRIKTARKLNNFRRKEELFFTGKHASYLIPNDLRINPRLEIILNSRAGDVFAFAELCLLVEPHFGVVAKLGVVLRHREGHGHLHAVRRVPAMTKRKYAVKRRKDWKLETISKIKGEQTRVHQTPLK